jgi:hypothetical protein
MAWLGLWGPQHVGGENPVVWAWWEQHIETICFQTQLLVFLPGCNTEPPRLYQTHEC